MDFHVEQLVPQKKTAVDYLIAFGICLITVIVWMLIIVFLLRLGLIASILLVLSGWGAFRLLQTRNIEYEYELTNYYLDIDKILGKSRRKKAIEIDLHNVELCTYVTANEFNNTHGIDKILDFSGDVNADGRVFIDYHPEGTPKTRIIITPCDKLKEYISKAAPKTTRL